jgi:hypothetical protein
MSAVSGKNVLGEFKAKVPSEKLDDALLQPLRSRLDLPKSRWFKTVLLVALTPMSLSTMMAQLGPGTLCWNRAPGTVRLEGGH